MTAALVEVPGFPGDHVRALTAIEFVEMHEVVDESPLRRTIRFAHLCGVDGDGNRLWPTLADAEAAPWPRVTAVVAAGLPLLGIGVEELAGN